MAVSMSAGFMRSDYMISDAALPLRMEELDELEQSAKFSEILSDIGNYEPTSREIKAAEDVQPTEESVIVDVPKDSPKALSKAEMKALARAVVKGDIKLTDIPEEMRSEVLLSVIAMMMAGVPEDEIPELKENYEEGAEVVTEPVEAILTDKRPTDKSGELQELIQMSAGTNTVDVNEANSAEITQTVGESNVPTEDIKAAVTAQPVITEENAPAIAEEIPVQVISTKAEKPTAESKQENSEAKTEVEAADIIPMQTEADTAVQTEFVQTAAETAAPVINADAAQPKETTEVKAADSAVNAVTTEGAVATDKIAVQGAQKSDTQQSGAGSNGAASGNITAARTRLNEIRQDPKAEFEQLRKVISEVTVKVNEPQQKAQTAETVQVAAADISKSRVVVKSDELQMLKNAVKPVISEAQTEADITVAAKADTEQPVQTAKPAQTDMNADVTPMAVPVGELPQGNDMPVVFVRSDGTEVMVKPSEVMEQVTDSIVQQNVTENGSTEYSVTLTPEDLGSITVKLTKAADGALSVSITADNARTQRIIDESGLALQNSLKQNGIQLESWQTVNGSQQETRAQDYSGSSKNPYYQEEENSENNEAEDTSFAELISAM